MKYFVRILSALLILATVFSMIACSKKKDDADGSEGGSLDLNATGEASGSLGSDGETGSTAEPSEEASENTEYESKDLSSYEDPTMEAPTMTGLSLPEGSSLKITQVTAGAEEDYKKVELNADDVYTGSLILVNPQNALKNDPADILVKMYDHRAGSEAAGKYQLANAEYTFIHKGVADAFTAMVLAANAADARCAKLHVTEAYRTVETQQDKFVKAGGVNAFKPNHSDFQTGYSLHLNYYDGKNPYSFSDKNDDAQAVGAIIAGLADDYGFVQRYPAGKSAYTGLKDDVLPYLYRYVGVPHARVMTEGNYSLEEYIAGIKNYTESNPMRVEDGENIYHIFYVPAAKEGKTSFKVLDGYKYEWSGNNVDGFVVTVTMK